MRSQVWCSSFPAIILEWFLNETITANEEVLTAPWPSHTGARGKRKDVCPGFKGSGLINKIFKIYSSPHAFKRENCHV